MLFLATLDPSKQNTFSSNPPDAAKLKICIFLLCLMFCYQPLLDQKILDGSCGTN